MFLWHILRVKPFAGLSILLCLATILACVLLERRRANRRTDRFLIGALGLLSVYQGMRILQGAGVLTISMGSSMDDAIELVIAAFYLMAALLLRLSSMNQMEVESAIRLARAAPPRAPRQLEPARDFSLDSISWAMPRVSDGAFKLYAYLCLRAGNSNGRVPVGAQDIRLQLGKTREELDGYLGELQKAGAVQVNRETNNLNIELVAQTRRPSAQILDEIPRSTVTLPV